MTHHPDDLLADAWRDACRAETRAVLDSPRPFAWYFIADAEG